LLTIIALHKLFILVLINGLSVIMEMLDNLFGIFSGLRIEVYIVDI